MERGHWEADRHTGRRPHVHEDRDGGDASKIQGAPRIASKPPEAVTEARNRFTLMALGRNRPSGRLDLKLLAS